MHVLTVIHPFGDYGRGARITKPEDILAVLNGENAHHIVHSGTADDISKARADAKAAAEKSEAEPAQDHE